MFGHFLQKTAFFANLDLLRITEAFLLISEPYRARLLIGKSLTAWNLQCWETFEQQFNRQIVKKNRYFLQILLESPLLSGHDS